MDKFGNEIQIEGLDAFTSRKENILLGAVAAAMILLILVAFLWTTR